MLVSAARYQVFGFLLVLGALFGFSPVAAQSPYDVAIGRDCASCRGNRKDRVGRACRRVSPAHGRRTKVL
jgi:hypothetical protein